MGQHILNRQRNTTWTIDENNDSWIVGKRGKITASDMHGIYADSFIASASVRIDGVIGVEGNNSHGVYLQSLSARVAVSEAARISSEYVALYYSNDEGSVRIDNDGVLSDCDRGIRAYAAQDGAAIRNDGRILANGAGISIGGAGAMIVNSGTIKAGTGISVEDGSNDYDPLKAENATHIVNTGKITGSDDSIYAEDVAVNIRNRGVLTGDVWMHNGQDVFNNRGGVINGNIYGDDGDDVFNMVGGKLNGILYGGDGDDVVTLSSLATVYVEEAGGGFDTVRINGSYQLGGYIEKLVLLGKGNHTGIGNDRGNEIFGNRGDNALYGQGNEDELYGGAGNDTLEGGGDNDWLYGGAGNDTLSGGDTGDWLDGGTGNDTLLGGAGGDVFIFRAGFGRDTIVDFEDAADRIDLSAYELAGFQDLDGRISQVGENVVITFSDTDRLTILNMTTGLIDGNDFIF